MVQLQEKIVVNARNRNVVYCRNIVTSLISCGTLAIIANGFWETFDNSKSLCICSKF
jgi:hypothetical protein